MKKLKRITLRFAFFIMTLMLLIFGVQGYQLNKLIKRVDNQIAVDQKELEIGEKKLKKLENEITQMNTHEYIEKIAREELGMVKKEDIVLRER